MEIILGKTAGFCYGVRNAVEKAEAYVKQHKEKSIFCLGELVHNGQVIDKLEQDGIKFIDTLSEIEKYEAQMRKNQDKMRKNKEKTVIIRAHGEPKTTYTFLEERNIEVLDLTCPNVLAIHRIVEEYSKQGWYIFLIGDKKHPEVIGTAGFSNGQCSIIEVEEDIDKALEEVKNSNLHKLLVVAQTTYSLEKFNKIVEKIRVADTKGIVENLEIKNTICNATKLRQEETEELAKRVDSMIIIGGKNSSNTKKLYEISAKECEKVVLVENVKELEEAKEKIGKEGKVGVMAGASTPKESIEEVIQFLRDLK